MDEVCTDQIQTQYLTFGLKSSNFSDLTINSSIDRI